MNKTFRNLDSGAGAAAASLTGGLAAAEPPSVLPAESGRPRMMVVLLRDGYCVGLPRWCRIEKACWEDAAFRMLTDHEQPDPSRNSDFCRHHLNALAGWFVPLRKVCQTTGLGSRGHGSREGI